MQINTPGKWQMAWQVDHWPQRYNIGKAGMFISGGTLWLDLYEWVQFISNFVSCISALWRVSTNVESLNSQEDLSYECQPAFPLGYLRAAATVPCTE